MEHEPEKNTAELDALLTRINQAFYEADPMNTGCQENELHDEYARVAQTTVNYMVKGESKREAISHALTDWFDELATDEKVQRVCDALPNELAD